MSARCEARIVRTPNNILAEGGFTTSLSCQLCERPIAEYSMRVRDRQSILTEYNFVLLWLQKCPKLIARGYKEGVIPLKLLPSIEKRSKR